MALGIARRIADEAVARLTLRGFWSAKRLRGGSGRSVIGGRRTAGDAPAGGEEAFEEAEDVLRIVGSGARDEGVKEGRGRASIWIDGRA